MSEHVEEKEMEEETVSKKQKGRVLVVDDEKSARSALLELLEDEGYQVEQAKDGYRALGILDEGEFDIVLTDLRMPLMTGIQLLEKAREKSIAASFIIMTAFGSVEDAVIAMKSGAEDFIMKPLNFEAVQLIVDRTLQRRRMSEELKRLKEKRDLRSESERAAVLMGSSSMKHVFYLASQVADSPASVLICGETGTGKQMMARYIHDNSVRKDKEFYYIHCGAMSDELLEQELFGVEPTRSSQEKQDKESVFERIEGGTLFLDEISEISMNLQVKLFRYLQSREYTPVNGRESRKADIRIIASSTQPLENAVRQGRFREDLYYRVNVVRIDMPLLSARRMDIPELVQRFVYIYAEANHKDIKTVSPKFLEILENHDWPGNVQELENVVERAVVLCNGDTLLPSHLPENLGSLNGISPIVARGISIPGSNLYEIERYAIMQTYEATGGKTAETAEILDVSQRKVQYKIREYMNS